MFPPLEYWTEHIWYLDPHCGRLLMLVNLDPEYLELVIIPINPETCLSKSYPELPGEPEELLLGKQAQLSVLVILIFLQVVIAHADIKD